MITIQIYEPDSSGICLVTCELPHTDKLYPGRVFKAKSFSKFGALNALVTNPAFIKALK